MNLDSYGTLDQNLQNTFLLSLPRAEVTDAPGERCTAPSPANLGPSAPSTGLAAWWTRHDTTPPSRAPRTGAWKPLALGARVVGTGERGVGRGGFVPSTRSRALPTLSWCAVYRGGYIIPHERICVFHGRRIPGL